MLDLDQVSSSCQMLGEIYLERMEAVNAEPSLQNKIVLENSCLSGNMKHVDSPYDHCLHGSPLLHGRKTTSEGRGTVEDVQISENSALVLKQHDLDKSKLVEVASVMQNACVTHSFPDGHCKALVHDGSNVLTEVVTDDVDSSSSHHEREQPEDGENDEILGGLFAFSE